MLQMLQLLNFGLYPTENKSCRLVQSAPVLTLWVFIDFAGNQISPTPVLESIGQSPSPKPSFPVAVATEAANSAACPERSHPCPGSSACIAATQFCDGEADCPHGLDELGCLTGGAVVAHQPGALNCRKGSKACRDGRQCVLYSHVCDGEPDCGDGSDEDECQLTCKEG